MVQRVGHRRPVVADPAAHGDRQLLTTLVFLLLLNDAAARAAASRCSTAGRIIAAVHRHRQCHRQRQPQQPASRHFTNNSASLFRNRFGKP